MQAMIAGLIGMMLIGCVPQPPKWRAYRLEVPDTRTPSR